MNPCYSGEPLTAREKALLDFVGVILLTLAGSVS